jgi:hypothetical protein
MYAYIHEMGRIFRGGVQVGGSATYFSRPTPTTPCFASGSMPALHTIILATANLYSLP